MAYLRVSSEGMGSSFPPSVGLAGSFFLPRINGMARRRAMAAVIVPVFTMDLVGYWILNKELALANILCAHFMRTNFLVETKEPASRR